MDPVVFITGGTGTLGRELVRRYARKEPPRHVKVLVRG